MAAVSDHNVSVTPMGADVAEITVGALEFLFLCTAYRAWKNDARKRRREVAAESQ